MDVADPYRWLERGADPDVQAWVQKEDSLARSVLDAIPFRPLIAKRLGELLDSGDVETPVRAGRRIFQARRSAGQQKPVLYVRNTEDSPDRVLLDPNSWPKDDHRTLQGFWPSRDGRMVVFATSPNNTTELFLEVVDVDSAVHSDEIGHLYDTEASWSASGDGFYYRWSPSDSSISLSDLPGHAEIRFHRLGTPAATDAIIRAATGDPRITEYPTASATGHWLFLLIQHGFTRQDIVYRDLRDSRSQWVVLAANAEAWNQIYEDRDVFFLKTTEGAPRGRVYRIDPTRPERAHWREIVPQKLDATLDAMCLAAR
jgi:prolyl oligopeptidase